MKRLLIFICLLFTSIYLNGSSDFSDIFHRIEMEFDYLVEDIFFEDLNNDNLRDISILTKATEKKKLLIFFQNGDGFSSDPSQILDFDERAIIFDVGDITNQFQWKEIVYLTNTSLKYYRFEENFYNPEPVELIYISSIFLSPSPESPVRSKFIRDVNRSELGKLFIPEPNNLKILSEENDGIFKESQKVNLGPIFTNSSQFRFSEEDFEIFESFSQKVIINIPMLSIGDFNGDKKRDIISIFKDRIEVFFQNEKEEFSKEPDFEIDLDILTEKEKKIPSPPMFKVHASDLNNNGLIDILVSKSQIKTMTSLSKIYIYLNKKGKINITPDQILVNENALGFPEILDINGDSHKDLIISELKMGIFQIFKMLLTKRLAYKDAIYLGRDGRYPKSPHTKIESEIRFDFDDPEKPEEDISFFSGDFNRDGIKDILRRIDRKNKLVIFLGKSEERNKIFSEKASYEVKEELPPKIIIKDLNNDKISDIIFDFRKVENKKLVLFLSK